LKSEFTKHAWIRRKQHNNNSIFLSAMVFHCGKHRRTSQSFLPVSYEGQLFGFSHLLHCLLNWMHLAVSVQSLPSAAFRILSALSTPQLVSFSALPPGHVRGRRV
jgi:hypothetical protein